MTGEPAAHHGVKAENPIAGLLNHLARRMNSKEPEMSVIQQSHTLILEFSQQQFCAHSPVGDIGKGNENTSAGRKDALRIAQNGLRLKQMFKHITEGDQIESFVNGAGPIAVVQ